MERSEMRVWKKRWWKKEGQKVSLEGGKTQTKRILFINEKNLTYMREEFYSKPKRKSTYLRLD